MGCGVLITKDELGVRCYTLIELTWVVPATTIRGGQEFQKGSFSTIRLGGPYPVMLLFAVQERQFNIPGIGDVILASGQQPGFVSVVCSDVCLQLTVVKQQLRVLFTEIY